MIHRDYLNTVNAPDHVAVMTHDRNNTALICFKDCAILLEVEIIAQYTHSDPT